MTILPHTSVSSSTSTVAQIRTSKTYFRLACRSIALLCLVGVFIFNYPYYLEHDLTSKTDTPSRSLLSTDISITSATNTNTTLESVACAHEPADPIWTIIFYILGVLYCFICLAIIADEFFCPALDLIADSLGMSPDVAGATLMAAGMTCDVVCLNNIHPHQLTPFVVYLFANRRQLAGTVHIARGHLHT